MNYKEKELTEIKNTMKDMNEEINKNIEILKKIILKF
jgi:hypothetical protein